MAKSKTATEQPGAAVCNPLLAQNMFGIDTASWGKLPTQVQLALMEACGLFQGRGKDLALFIIFAEDYNGERWERLIWAKNINEAFREFYTHTDGGEEWNQSPHGYRLPDAPVGAGVHEQAWHTLEHSYSDPDEFVATPYDDEPEDWDGE